MWTILASELEPGQSFDRPLYTAQGRLLLQAGVALTAGMCQTLLRAAEQPGSKSPVYVPETDEEAAALERRTADLSSAVPAASSEPMVEIKPEMDPGPGAGVAPADAPEIGPDADDLDRARRRERRQAFDAKRDILMIRARMRREADGVIAVRSARWSRLGLKIGSSVDRVPVFDTDSSSVVDTREEAIAVARIRADGCEVVRRVLSRLIDGQTSGPGLLVSAVDEIIDLCSCVPARYAMLALGSARGVDSIPEQCFATGVLAIGASVRLGWSRSDVRTAGLAGMLADAGLALIPQPIRRAGRPLTDVETNSVRRHPRYSAALLERMGGLPEEVQLAVSQHHEREDGSGYPMGIRGKQIHDLAKVLGVADTLAGLTGPRAHRPPTPGHAAITEVTRAAGAGRFDKGVVRALIDACGLFPVGSYVQLSTGDTAVVVGPARQGELDRPVVRVLRRSWAGVGEAGAGIAGMELSEAVDLRTLSRERVTVVGTGVTTPEPG